MAEVSTGVDMIATGTVVHRSYNSMTKMCDDGRPTSISKSLERIRSKSFNEGVVMSSTNYYSCEDPVPGTIAAIRRQQMALQQAQRKMKIAHYGRSKSAKFESTTTTTITNTTTHHQPQHKRCTFITNNSDPIYVTYHDEEWGVPVHDDKMLFELLVLSGAQVGSDWTSILKKRQNFRNAFSRFDPEMVAKLNDKEMSAISRECGIDMSQVRGVVDNACKILEIKKEFGSLEKYIWGFVNGKPISKNYKLGNKIPVKTSKSETISKDMLRRGFRLVGPTVVHSFMQVAGLTNDHLITCHRHLPCTLMASSSAPLTQCQSNT